MIDRRKAYYIILDTETTNSYKDENGKLVLTDSLPYDLGFVVVDKMGNVYERFSIVISDIFYNERALMDSAYYRAKLPNYYAAIDSNERIVLNEYEVKTLIRDTCAKYGIRAIVAHNARFDRRALNNLTRYVTKSKYRYFLPHGVPVWDTMSMAHDTIVKQKTYRAFCEQNGYMTKHKTPRPRETAEILYRYISKDYDFDEIHEGLADVLIEKEIFTKCLAQHKRMRKEISETSVLYEYTRRFIFIHPVFLCKKCVPMHSVRCV